MRVWKLCCLLMACCLLLTGCKTDQETVEYYLYQVTGDGIGETAYEPSTQDTEGMVEEMAGLLNEKGSQEEPGPLPQEAVIASWKLDGGTLYLDMEASYGNLDSVQEILCRAVLVKNFVQIPQIKYVQITVAGEELKDSEGNSIGLLSLDSFLENSGEEINSYQYSDITLYFTNEDGDRLVEEKRKVYYISSTPLERVVVEQLIRGPQEDGHYPVISPNTGIIGVTVADGIGYVNLDDKFVTEALTVQEEIPVYAIVNSLIQVGTVKKVQISVNGETQVTFRESMELDKLYEWNEELTED